MFCAAAAAAEERRDTEGEEVLSYVWNISAGDHGQKALKLHTAVEVEFSWVSLLDLSQSIRFYLEFTAYHEEENLLYEDISNIC